MSHYLRGLRRHFTIGFNIHQLTALAVLGAFLGSCQKPTETAGSITARVRNEVLRAEDLTKWENSLPRPPSLEDKNSFIRRWVEDELLYQAALDKNLLTDPWVAERLRELTRSLIISKYLDAECAEIAEPSLEEVKAYYLKHQGEFVWPHLRLVAEYWRGENSKLLERMRTAIFRDRNPSEADNWEGLESGRIALNSPAGADPQIWQLVSRLKIDQVSEVIKIQKDYWIFKLIARNEAGSAQDLAEVQEEIAARLKAQAYTQRRGEILRKLTAEFKQKNELSWITGE